MDRNAFEKTLRAEGYEVLTRDVAAGSALDEHDHARDSKGLILNGSFTVDAEGESRTYKAGEFFALAAGIPHAERAGADGARILLGRRAVAD